jgi:hypothetical protein
MNYRYPRVRIHEIVKAKKCLDEGASITPPGKTSPLQKFDASLQLVDGPFCDLRFTGKAVRLDDPTSYHTNLLLDQRRVRGVGFSPIAKQNFRSSQRMPKGWHENVCDPNSATDHPDWNRHMPLPDFSPTDYADFVKLSAERWNIDIGWEEGLL